MKWLVGLILILFNQVLFSATPNILNSNNWFEGGTKYKVTGENIRVSWTPHPDNIPWENNYVFDLEVIFFERDEIVINEKALNQLEYNFSLDRVGHYLVKVRACYAANPTECSEWSDSWNETNEIQFGDTMVNGWWVFVWIAPPTGPGTR